MQTRALPLLLALAASPRVTRAGDEWNRFRGPLGSGVAPDEARLPDALDPEQNLLWKRELGPGLSSPCVSGTRIFLTESGSGELATLCLDRRDGALLWRRAVRVDALERAQELNGPATPTPACDGEHVVVYFGSFGILGYDLEGQELWRRPLPMPKNTFGTAVSPILAGGRLLFISDNNEGSFLESIDPASGKTLWKRDRAGFQSGWSTPGVWRNGEVDELLVLGVWWLTAYDLADGSERWSVPGLTDEPITTPFTGEGLVFVTSYNMKTNPEVIGLPSFVDILVKHDHDGDGQIDAQEAAENKSVLSRFDADGEGDHPLRIFFRYLDEDRNGEITAQEWQKLVAWLAAFEHRNALVAIRPGTSERKAEIAWQFPRGVPECPSPLCYRGRVYAVADGGLFTCLDAQTGEVLFHERLAARGPYYASLVAGDGKIYAASARGELSVLAAEPRLDLRSSHDFGERIMATPALGDGALYLRTEAHMFAFGASD